MAAKVAAFVTARNTANTANNAYDAAKSALNALLGARNQAADTLQRP